ncbi:hypothetical protein [Georgenia thermotolerans]|uniref:Uncharacterized protein n=1 Tax=Georgenia thermotolerans TaxID=527326 RepID=A0A7J5UIU9_9MICO|nr:hypothetical protein [Georgenia thermotolerans]KAE8762302.1 hypothetical protein GB883_20045 [Georgenia thermotolerans]
MLRTIGTRVLAGLLAAVAVGVLAGAAARLLMRLLVVLSGGEPRFSVLGTFFIVVVFIIAMVPGAVTGALGARRTGHVLLGLGAGFLIFQSVNIAVQEDATEVIEAGSLMLALAILVLVGFAVVAVAQAVAVARLARALARRSVGGDAPLARVRVREAAAG